MTQAMEPLVSKTRTRSEVPEPYLWNLSDIFPSWEAWEECLAAFEARIEDYRSLKGRLGEGAQVLLRALELADDIGQLSYKIYYYPMLTYDQDQRDNAVNARRQRAQALFALWQQASAWFRPELLAIPQARVHEWMDADPKLGLYRFALDDLYRLAEHVLGEEGERVLSYASRFSDAPQDAYQALSTADIQFPTIPLSTGESVTITYGKYRAILATNRNQADRARTFQALYRTFAANLNTYAAIYGGVCQRDWFEAQARRYTSTLAAALDGNRIPEEVVENLIAVTRSGVEPLQRYHKLRKQALGLDEYHLYDTAIPIVDVDLRYPWEMAVDAVLASLAPLGESYGARARNAFSGGWIDVYENQGKRSGAYCAGVYGVHPYMLLNYNDTMDDIFTLAHELGHALHTMYSHEHQPFVYASYTIFVAEVASTLNEGLLLDHLLSRAPEPGERIALLQHAIDSILGTFYTQVLFASWELEAHRMVERGEAITADSLSDLYLRLLQEFYGDALTIDDLYRITWARIPHFYQSSYYVYQYATSFAASAKILDDIRSASGADRDDVVARYIKLLSSGGNDYPIEQLRAAGVDLSQKESALAIVQRLDALVSRLAEELARG